MIRVVFMGTPAFAVPTLRALASVYPLVGVITQPDRAAGRGRQVAAAPVKQAALELGLPVYQPVRLREPEALAQLRQWAPDLIVVAAFGQILRPDVLQLPPFGCVNVHASLLPRHRGAAPIPAAILAGDEETGVTIMQMDIGLDTGPILAARPAAILPDDTAGSLAARLAALGAELLLETLPAYLAGSLRPIPQDSARATYAGQLKKEDGLLNFNLPAAELARRVRAFSPWPGAFAHWQGEPLKIHRARPVQMRPSMPPGTVFWADGLPAVACGAGALLLEEVQPPGKKPMPGAAFARGARAFIGAALER